MYIEILDDDIERAKQALSDEKIMILDVFDSAYEKMCEVNIKDYLEMIECDGGGYLRNSEAEKYILDMDDSDERLLLVEKATSLMYNNEYMSEVIGESTAEAIEGGLRELFILRNSETNE